MRNDTSVDEGDLDIVRLVENAFDEQTVPKRPSNAETRRFLKTESVTPQNHSQGVSPKRFSAILSGIPAVAATILIAVAMWPGSRLENEQTTEVDDVPESIKLPPTDTPAQPPDSPKPMPPPTPPEPPSETAERRENGIDNPKTVPLPDDADAPRVDVTSPPTETSLAQNKVPSRLYGFVSEFNGSIKNKSWDATRLHSLLGPFVDSEHGSTLEALRAMGRPQSIESIIEGTPPNQRWLCGDNQVAFTYTVGVNLLLSDVQKFVDGYFGARVFESILDGILRDPEGPQVDLRRDVFAQMSGEVTIVVPRRAQPNEDKLILALSLKNAKTVESTIEKSFGAEPDSKEIDHLGHRVFLGANRNAVCIVDDLLIITDVELLKGALARRVE